MPTRTQEIIEYIADYIQQKHDDKSVWYIGICQEAHDIVFEALKRSSQFWMYIETDSQAIAQEVIEHFVNNDRLRKDVRKSQSDKMGSVVYVYRKQRTPVTKS